MEHAGEVKPFWPQPGDIIIRDIRNVDVAKYSQIISIEGLVELYKDEFFSVRSITDDECALSSFNNLLFRPGDHALRIGEFKFPTRKWEDHKYGELFIYWPDFHSKGPWIRVPSVFRLDHGLRFQPPTKFQPSDNEHPMSASYICNKFQSGEFHWAEGDILVRKFDLYRQPEEEEWNEESGMSPRTWWEQQEKIKTEIEEWNERNPWETLLGAGQVLADWNMDLLHIGDLIVRVRAQHGPRYRHEYKTYSTRLDVEAFLHLGDNRWRNVGRDGFSFDFHRGIRDVKNIHRKYPSLSNIPQPGDIKISLDRQFQAFDPIVGRGGYTQLHQNCPTVGAELPGDSEGCKYQRQWANSGNPIILRMGRFEHWRRPVYIYQVHEQPWVWFSNNNFELYGRHPTVLGSWMLLSSADKSYPIRPPEQLTLEPWERFERQPYTGRHSVLDESSKLRLNEVAPKFAPRERDVVIRQDINNDTFGHKNRKVFPWVPRRPLYGGDLLVRFEDNASMPQSGFSWKFTVELYATVMNEENQQVFIFRGRDQVFYGETLLRGEICSTWYRHMVVRPEPFFLDRELERRKRASEKADRVQKPVTAMLSQSNPLLASGD